MLTSTELITPEFGIRKWLGSRRAGSLQERETGKVSKNHTQFLIMSSLKALFYSVDDFCKVFIPAWRNQELTGQRKQHNRPHSLTLGVELCS